MIGGSTAAERQTWLFRLVHTASLVAETLQDSLQLRFLTAGVPKGH
jgi:hypothetical protein